MEDVDAEVYDPHACEHVNQLEFFQRHGMNEVLG
jgi:hypothetical protein